MRIAQPRLDLDRAEHFWVDGLGLDVLYRAGPESEGGHPLLMLGWPEAAWHLELVGDPSTGMASNPTEEDLLVLHVGDSVDDQTVNQLIRAGGQRVSAP